LLLVLLLVMPFTTAVPGIGTVGYAAESV